MAPVTCLALQRARERFCSVDLTVWREEGIANKQDCVRLAVVRTGSGKEGQRVEAVV